MIEKIAIYKVWKVWLQLFRVNKKIVTPIKLFWLRSIRDKSQQARRIENLNILDEASKGSSDSKLIKL